MKGNEGARLEMRWARQEKEENDGVWRRLRSITFHSPPAWIESKAIPSLHCIFSCIVIHPIVDVMKCEGTSTSRRNRSTTDTSDRVCHPTRHNRQLPLLNFWLMVKTACIKMSICRNYTCPFDFFWTFSLLCLTPCRNSSNNGMVCARDIQASVMETPYFNPAGPSGGMACLPSLMLDSIMTPRIDCEVGPLAS